MRFFKLTFSYMGKNFLYLFLFALIPAIFFGLTLSPFKLVEFINNYSQVPVVAFGSIFKAMFPLGVLQLLIILVTILLLAIFVSAILGQMEHHFRSGKLNLTAIKDHVNSNILILLANIGLLFFVYFILTFSISAILFLLHLLLSGLNTSPTIFNVVLSNILVSIIIILYAIISHIVLLNISNMINNGTELRYSLSETIKLTQKNTFLLTITVLLPYVFFSIFVSLFVNTSILPIINVIGVLFLIMYYASFAMTSYFELSKLERYDNRKKYFRK